MKIATTSGVNAYGSYGAANLSRLDSEYPELAKR
jgi:hypothetical protein